MEHYPKAIRDFAALNGLCSSISESKHIKAIKEPWRRSNRYNALGQMLATNQRIDKLAAARVHFNDSGMLEGNIVDALMSDSSGGVCSADPSFPHSFLLNAASEDDLVGPVRNEAKSDDSESDNGDIPIKCTRPSISLSAKPVRTFPQSLNLLHLAVLTIFSRKKR
jgi:hypothetical protein